MVRIYVDSALTGRKVERPWLGARLEALSREVADGLGLDRASGALVTRVWDKGPAAEAGLQAGDVIIAVDSVEVADARSVLYRMQTRGVGNRVRVDVLRKGKPVTISVALRSAPAPSKDDLRDVKGQIKSITDFGIFIGLEGGIDGLVHLSDISWDVPGEEAVHNYKKGQEIEAAVLAIDSERERISLGIKQLDKDPFSAWLADHPKNSVVKGVVTEVDARGAVVDLGDGVVGTLRASELTRERVEDARSVLKVGDEVEARFTNVDRKNRSVALSIKAKEVHEEAEALSSYKSEGAGAPTGTTLGELLKEKMSGGTE
jgi:predicted RNA-binding protein with RPS1 domain